MLKSNVENLVFFNVDGTNQKDFNIKNIHQQIREIVVLIKFFI